MVLRRALKLELLLRQHFYPVLEKQMPSTLESLSVTVTLSVSERTTSYVFRLRQTPLDNYATAPEVKSDCSKNMSACQHIYAV